MAAETDRSDQTASVSSSASVPEPEQSGDHSSSTPSPKRRTSTIRFSEDTLDSVRSSMSGRRRLSSSNEITPINQADSQVGRKQRTETSQTNSPPVKAAAASTQSNDGQADEDVDHGQPWYRKMADRYGSISLDNKGSVARDHLALERTFLAWLRTSLAFASIGIAITQLFRLNRSISSSHSRRSHPHEDQDQRPFSDVPFSPYLGHAVPAELLPYLQGIIPPHDAAAQQPQLGPTLLDQLLLLSSDGIPAISNHPVVSAVDDSAAMRLRHVGKPLGATFLGISVVVLLVGFHRYFEAQYWIVRGKFPASRGSIALVAFIAGALTVASLVVVLVIAPTNYEK